MSAAEWYVALFSLGSGAGIVLFWIVAAARREIEGLAGGRRDFSWHVAAEILTGALLAASAVALIVLPGEGWPRLLNTLALGALVYSLAESPGHYIALGRRGMAMMFGAVWVATIPAVWLRLAVGLN